MICPKSSMHWKPPVFSSVNQVYFKNCFYCYTSNLKKEHKIKSKSFSRYISKTLPFLKADQTNFHFKDL